MPRRPGFSKARAKRLARECNFCGEMDLKLLDVHRIVPGSQYSERGTLVLCSLCHRKVHAGRIIIEGKYFSTSGRWKVFYTEDGVDKIT